MTTELDKYLSADDGPTAREFARKVGCSEPHISLVRHGRKLPSLDLAFLMEEASGGKVPAASWRRADLPEQECDTRQMSLGLDEVA